MAIFASIVPNGIRSKVVARLNVVCIFAICFTESAENDSITPMNGVARHITVKIAVPIMLNNQWITVVRFAAGFVPIAASTAVIAGTISNITSRRKPTKQVHITIVDAVLSPLNNFFLVFVAFDITITFILLLCF